MTGVTDDSKAVHGDTPGMVRLTDGLGPLVERALRELDDATNQTWRGKRARWAEALRAQEAEMLMLRTALRQVAQAHAWLAFGECRSFGSDVTLLSASDADAVARVALGEYREGPNKH